MSVKKSELLGILLDGMLGQLESDMRQSRRKRIIIGIVAALSVLVLAVVLFYVLQGVSI